jgi:hypothetical protein
MLKNSKTLAAFGLSFVLSLFFVINTVHAQTVTPTASVSPTASPAVSETPTPSVELTPTPDESAKPNPIDTAIKIGTQLPWSKKIPVTIQITPKTNAKTLEIRWPTRSGFTISPRSKTWTNVQSGTTYSETFEFDPLNSGRQSLSASVVLTTFDTNYVSSVPVEINLNGEKIVSPISQEYQTYVFLYYAAQGILFFIIIPLAVFLAILYIRRVLVPKWIQDRLNEPI